MCARGLCKVQSPLPISWGAKSSAVAPLAPKAVLGAAFKRSFGSVAGPRVSVEHMLVGSVGGVHSRRMPPHANNLALQWRDSAAKNSFRRSLSASVHRRTQWTLGTNACIAAGWVRIAPLASRLQV